MSFKARARIADRSMMDVFARADAGSRPPLRAHDEPVAAIFAGTPSQVANYLAARMPAQPDTAALLTAELTHLAREGLATDSLCLMLNDSRKVTIRPGGRAPVVSGRP
jgi:hypothetical protein